MPYITYPGIQGQPHVTQQQYDQVYAPLGWTIVGNPDPAPGIGSATLQDLVNLGAAKQSDLIAHETASDPHGAKSFAASQIEAHRTATDPHSDRVYSDSQLIAHVNAPDPHGTRAWALATFTLNDGSGGTGGGTGGPVAGYAQLDDSGVVVGDQWLTD